MFKWDNMTVVIMLLFTVLAVAARSLFNAVRVYSHLRKLPSPPVTSVLGGHIGVLQHPRGHRIIQQACRQLGGVIALRTFWRPVRIKHMLFGCVARHTLLNCV